MLTTDKVDEILTKRNKWSDHLALSEHRGEIRLKAIQIPIEQRDLLRDLAARTGKPQRWHLERAIKRYLGQESDDYALRDLRAIALEIVRVAASQPMSLRGATKAVQLAAVMQGHAEPHLQSVRRHLRAAAKALPEVAACFEPRNSTSFSPEEDRMIEELRIEGRSLAEISALNGRRRHVLLRRLNYLAELAEQEHDES